MNNQTYNEQLLFVLTYKLVPILQKQVQRTIIVCINIKFGTNIIEIGTMNNQGYKEQSKVQRTIKGTMNNQRYNEQSLFVLTFMFFPLPVTRNAILVQN